MKASNSPGKCSSKGSRKVGRLETPHLRFHRPNQLGEVAGVPNKKPEETLERTSGGRPTPFEKHMQEPRRNPWKVCVCVAQAACLKRHIQVYFFPVQLLAVDVLPACDDLEKLKRFANQLWDPFRHLFYFLVFFFGGGEAHVSHSSILGAGWYSDLRPCRANQAKHPQGGGIAFGKRDGRKQNMGVSFGLREAKRKATWRHIANQRNIFGGFEGKQEETSHCEPVISKKAAAKTAKTVGFEPRRGKPWSPEGCGDLAGRIHGEPRGSPHFRRSPASLARGRRNICPSRCSPKKKENTLRTKDPGKNRDSERKKERKTERERERAPLFLGVKRRTFNAEISSQGIHVSHPRCSNGPPSHVCAKPKLNNMLVGKCTECHLPKWRFVGIASLRPFEPMELSKD